MKFTEKFVTEPVAMAIILFFEDELVPVLRSNISTVSGESK